MGDGLLLSLVDSFCVRDGCAICAPMRPLLLYSLFWALEKRDASIALPAGHILLPADSNEGAAKRSSTMDIKREFVPMVKLGLELRAWELPIESELTLEKKGSVWNCLRLVHIETRSAEPKSLHVSRDTHVDMWDKLSTICRSSPSIPVCMNSLFLVPTEQSR